MHYPAASDDIVAAFRWAFESELCPGPWALGGASAGANLATGATLRLLADGGLHPALVVLAYPTLLAVQPEPDAALRAALDADPEADTLRTRRRARNVRELPRRPGRRGAAPRDPGTGDRRRPRGLPADAHDQRRGRRTPRLGRALRRARSPTPAATSSCSPSPAPGTATSTGPKSRGCGIPRTHRRPPRRPPSRLEPTPHAASHPNPCIRAPTRRLAPPPPLPTEGSPS